MATRTRRRTAGAGESIAAQIQQLVRERDDLKVENANLKAQLEAINSALSRVGAQTVAVGRRRGRNATLPLAAPVSEKRKRRPITDPEILAKRNAALAKARAARAERLARARAAEQGEAAPAEPALMEGVGQ